MLEKPGLEALAKTQNPVLGYFDPLSLADAEFWDQGNEATIAWLRHAPCISVSRPDGMIRRRGSLQP